jgi:hypothetical protein
VVDTLSCRYVILNTMNTRLLGFDYVNKLYDNYSDFAEIYMHVDIQLLVNFI